VDTKKKELVGAFANKGRTWRPKGQPYKVKVHDFSSEAPAVPFRRTIAHLRGFRWKQ
jgi:hypothetical protein